MKTFSKLLSSLLACAAIIFGPAAFAQNAPIAPRPAGGLTLQLTTSSYKVVQPSAADAALNVLPDRASFSANAVLANRSNSNITFTFADPPSAAAKFEFVLSDQDGNEVWRSDEGIGIQVLTEATLKRGGVWRRAVRVPLIIDGTSLAVGSYTLLAYTDADKQVLAQTLLEVVAPPQDPKKGKIDGTVLKVTKPWSEGSPEVSEPYPGAWVTVQQLGDAPRARLFTWSGYSDANGKFGVDVPAGRYRVTAGEKIAIGLPGVDPGNEIIPDRILPSRSVEVAVAAGQTVEVVLKLIRPTPPTEQGIKGLVVRVINVDGVPTEAPIAGARVQVSQILPPGVAIGGFGENRGPYQWTGITDNEGRFEIGTPVGKFRVVATKTVNSGSLVLLGVGPTGFVLQPTSLITGSAEVEVAAGVFSDVKLSLKSIITPLPHLEPVNQ